MKYNEKMTFDGNMWFKQRASIQRPINGLECHQINPEYWKKVLNLPIITPLLAKNIKILFIFSKKVFYS